MLALPIMAFAALLSLWENPYQPFVKRTWVSNAAPKSGATYRSYETFEFNVCNRALRRLPQILDIGLGHLRWFGVSVATAEELDDRKDIRHMTRDNCPSGLIGTAQVNEPTTASTAQRFISDANYATSANWRLNLGLVGEAVSKLLIKKNANATEVSAL